MEYQNPQPASGPGARHRPAVAFRRRPHCHFRNRRREGRGYRRPLRPRRVLPGERPVPRPGRLPGRRRQLDHAAGVRAEVGETQVAVDIDLVALYGTPLHALADQIRAAVYAAVEELVGLQVIEVNIEINDVYVPGLAKPGTPAEARPPREAIQ